MWNSIEVGIIRIDQVVEELLRKEMEAFTNTEKTDYKFAQIDLVLYNNTIMTAPEVAIQNPEKRFSHETVNLLAGLGNHEAKMLFLLYLNEAGTMMTGKQLGEGFLEFMGPQAEWKPNIKLPSNYCAHSLEPIGHVIKGSVRTERGVATGYSISEFGQTKGLPAAGLLLEWSLRYPDISVQRVFGKADKLGIVVERNLETLSTLLQSDRPLATVEISGLEPTDRASNENEYDAKLDYIEASVERLVGAGILTKERAQVDNDRRFEILSADYPERSFNRGQTAELIYAFLREKTNGGERDFTFEECAAWAWSSLHTQGVAFDPVKVRADLLDSLGSKKGQPGIKRIDTFKEGRFTRIQIAEDKKQAIAEILQIARLLDTGDKAAVRSGQELAKTIAADPNAINMLNSKANRFSPFTSRLPREVAVEHLIHLLRTIGPADTDRLSEEHDLHFKTSLSAVAIQQVLRPLVKTGDVLVEKKRAGDNTNVLRNEYQLPQTDE